MKHLRTWAAWSSLAWIAIAAHAATPLTQLVNDQSAVVVSLHDVPGYMKVWKQSPMAKTWNDEQMKRFLAPMREKMKIEQWDELCKAETGYTVDELFGLAQGDALIAVTHLDLALDTPPSPGEFPLLIAVELGSNAPAVGKLIADLAAKDGGTIATQEFSGTTIHVYQEIADETAVDQFAWAIVESIGLFSPSRTELMKAIDAVQSGGVNNPVGQSSAFLRAKSEAEDAHLIVSINMRTVVPAVKRALEARREEGEGAAPMGLDPVAIVDALGLDAIEHVYITGKINEDSTESFFGMMYSDTRGILKLLAYGNGPAPQPAFVPQKWIAASSSRFSVKDAYAGLESLLESINPAIAGMVQGQIKGLDKQLGIDLKRDLIGSLGDEIVTGSAFPPGASAEAPSSANDLDQFYAFSLKDATAFTNAVEALKRMMGPKAETHFTKRDYLEHALYTYTPEVTPTNPNARGFSYAITPTYFFVGVGSSSTVEAALQGLTGDQPSLWNDPKVKQWLADVPAKASAIQYQDTRALVGAVIETLVRLAPVFAQATPSAEGEDEAGAAPAPADNPFDITAKPDPAAVARYWGDAFSYGWRDSNGLFFRSKLNHAQ